jgi:hypothetical protein
VSMMLCGWHCTRAASRWWQARCVVLVASVEAVAHLQCTEVLQQWVCVDPQLACCCALCNVQLARLSSHQRGLSLPVYGTVYYSSREGLLQVLR